MRGRIPETFDELTLLVAGGHLIENHFQDAKLMLAPGDSGNKELAKDLASFAVDGGALYIGLRELESGNCEIEPQPVADVPERIEAVAHSRINPPLGVEIHVLRAPGADSGVTVVEVTPSPQAPHMVDHRYWGRGDKRKYPMDDPEVLRLHERRKAWDRQSMDLLDHELSRDLGEDEREGPRLYLVAEPVAAADDLFEKLVPAKDWGKWLRNLVAQSYGSSGVRADPIAESVGKAYLRAGGWALASSGISNDRKVVPGHEFNLLDLEFNENGGMRLYSGTVSGSGAVIMDQRVAIIVYRLIEIAATIGASTGFRGHWDFGCAVTGIRGAISGRFIEPTFREPRFSEDEYKQTVRVTSHDISVQPEQVVRLLMARLLRSLGSDVDKYLEPFLAARTGGAET